MCQCCLNHSRDVIILSPACVLVESSPRHTVASEAASATAPGSVYSFPFPSTTSAGANASHSSTTPHPTTTNYPAKAFSSPPFLLGSPARIDSKTTAIHMHPGIPFQLDRAARYPDLHVRASRVHCRSWWWCVQKRGGKCRRKRFGLLQRKILGRANSCGRRRMSYSTTLR